MFHNNYSQKNSVAVLIAFIHLLLLFAFKGYCRLFLNKFAMLQMHHSVGSAGYMHGGIESFDWSFNTKYFLQNNSILKKKLKLLIKVNNTTMQETHQEQFYTSRKLIIKNSNRLQVFVSAQCEHKA